MGARNFLIEGVSCTGKTSVCKELQRRGYHAINGDTDLAYQGDPATGAPTSGHEHAHHIWCLEKVQRLTSNREAPVTFFCGGSRNFPAFIHLFDGVFVLEVDEATLLQRLHARHDEFGSKPAERELILRLHRTGEDIPTGGTRIDATRSLTEVVDEILRFAHHDGAA